MMAADILGEWQSRSNDGGNDWPGDNSPLNVAFVISGKCTTSVLALNRTVLKKIVSN